MGVTLIYLVIQIRHNTRSNQATLSWSMNQALADLNGRLSGDRELPDIWIRGCDSLETLDPIERERFERYAIDRLNLAEYAHSFVNREKVSVHIDYVAWMVQSIERSPGLQQFVESLAGKWVGSPELYEMYRDATTPGTAESDVRSPGPRRGLV